MLLQWCAPSPKQYGHLTIDPNCQNYETIECILINWLSQTFVVVIEISLTQIIWRNFFHSLWLIAPIYSRVIFVYLVCLSTSFKPMKLSVCISIDLHSISAFSPMLSIHDMQQTVELINEYISCIMYSYPEYIMLSHMSELLYPIKLFQILFLQSFGSCVVTPHCFLSCHFFQDLPFPFKITESSCVWPQLPWACFITLTHYTSL